MNETPSSLPHVLLTGAAGVIGSKIRKPLEASFRLRATDKRESPGDAWEYRQADLLDFCQIRSLVEGVDAVVHLAIAPYREYDESAEPPIDGLTPYQELMLDVNIRATAYLFEAARRADIRKIVYMSSLTVYFGDRSQDSYNESDPVNPGNLYACTKVFGENLARVYSRDFGISVICLRIGQPYPVNLERHDEYWKTNKRARSTYVAMEDIASAVRLALVSPLPFGIYNILSASDNPRFDITAAREIGYIPHACFTSDGLVFSEDGAFPGFEGENVTE